MAAIESESEYCRRQAERLRDLASQCDDPHVRDQLEKMAQDWADMAAQKEAALTRSA
jgi:hypothetical protein